jgi:hypothetical protein
MDKVSFVGIGIAGEQRAMGTCCRGELFVIFDPHRVID